MTHLASILLLSFLELLCSPLDSADLLFAGDAMQHAAQNVAARQGNGTYDYSECFALLEPYIQSADYAVVNLECPLGGRPYTGYPCFSAPDEFGWQLRKSGFDLILTANNHCLDRRDAGLRRTVAKLDEMKIPHIGTYLNAAARNRQLPFMVNLKGMKVAFLDYTYGTNGIPVQKDVVVDRIDLRQMETDINAARDAGAQVLCVFLHWGVEYTLSPVKEQKDLAQWLVDRGVDLIIGGHPHVVEPFKVVHSDAYDKDVLVVYSLGNFISNQKPVDTRGGAMVKVTLKVENGKPVVRNPRYRLFFCQHPSGRGDNYRLIPENMPEKVRRDSKPMFNQFMSRTHDLVMSKNSGVSHDK